MDALDYSIKAIPTEFKGRLYRSRLEAKWAAFFDLCGWQHEYEPYDLGTWSPDFLVRGRVNDVLVEVKPITRLDITTAHKMWEASTNAGFTGELLLVGASVQWDDFLGASDLGWLCSNTTPSLGIADHPGERFGLPERVALTPWFNVASMCRGDRGQFDFFCMFAPSKAGVEEFDDILGSVRTTFKSFDAREMWAEASNAVQWKPDTQRR